MRVPAALLVLVLAAVVGSPSASRAEKVKTNQTTKLLSRPGERGKVLLTLQEGKRMEVLAKDGRWLKVRVSGRTGWVPRSKVDVSDEIARNTRRRPFVDGRGRGRGFGGEEGPEDRVGADAIGDGVEPNIDDGEGDDGEGDDGEGDDGEGDDGDTVVIEEEPDVTRPTARVKAKTVALTEPDEEADEMFEATPGMVLYPGAKKGKYTEVENDDGDLGYVLTSSLEIEEDDGEDGASRTRAIGARARLGVTLLAQASGQTGKVKTSAATLALGGTYLRPYGKKLMIGGELTYDYAKAIPGIAVKDGMNNTGTTSIGLHNLRLRALAGYDLKKKSGMMLVGRLGFHYQSFQVSDVEDLTKNLSKLPSEIIQAPAIGVGLQLPRLTKQVGVWGSLDALPFSSVKQTKGLQDGASPSARGALFEAGLTYRWRKELDIIGTYNLTYLSMSYGERAPNTMRDPVMGQVSRGDQFHSFTAGVSKAF